MNIYYELGALGIGDGVNKTENVSVLMEAEVVEAA